MPGQKAPDFTLPHVTGREVSLSDYKGLPVVIIFAARDTGEQAGKIGNTIRSKYMPDEVPMISVADAHGTPRLLHGVVKGQLEKSYKKAAQDTSRGLQARGKPVPEDLSQIAVFTIDWDGKVGPSYGVSGVDKQAAAVLVDADGTVKGQAAGEEAGQKILDLLG